MTLQGYRYILMFFFCLRGEYKCAWLLPLNWQITCKQPNKKSFHVCIHFGMVNTTYSHQLDSKGWKWYNSDYAQHENGQHWADERCWRGLFIYLSLRVCVCLCAKWPHRPVCLFFGGPCCLCLTYTLTQKTLKKRLFILCDVEFKGVRKKSQG